MKPVTDRPVRFGELAGPLVHGATFFDWQPVATQAVAAAVDYPFEAILADDGIPFAPVVVSTSVDRYPGVGDAVTVGTVPLSASFPIRSPHIEGAELAYFEEYPRFTGVVLEEFLEDRGTSRGELGGEKRPFRLRNWEWEFRAPVPFESALRVDCDVRSVDDETVRVAHELSSDGRTNISGVTEYGCFDREGNPVPFDEAMLKPFRS